MRTPMTDLATLSPDHQPEHKLTLWERRKAYEEWLASGRSLPKPLGHTYVGPRHTARTDEGRSPPILASKRVQADAGAKGQLLNSVSPGAIVRIDNDGRHDPKLGDNIRLGFAEILLSKAKDADPATAERIANAT